MPKKMRMYFVVAVCASLCTCFTVRTTFAAIDCLALSPSSSQSDKAYCQNELNQIEAQLADLQVKQDQQKKQTGTLSGDVNYLNAQIKALQTKVKARNLAITQIKVNITEKVNTIKTLSQKVDREHAYLAQLMRDTNQFDAQGVVHVALSAENISSFYQDLNVYASLGEAIGSSVVRVKGAKKQTEAVKKDLEKKQDAEIDTKAELESTQKKVAQSEAEKKKLLSLSKQTEAAYQALAAQKKAQAAKIRSALFPLANSTQKIEFGTALQYAIEAQKLTGIDPAFLLAVLTQETNLGANVGQCYLTDQATGAGVGKNTGTPFSNVMKPMGKSGRKGDVDDFLRITSSFGLVWDKTAVSCPIAGAGGYGGAMGPAQFIPTTWALFEDRLRPLLGHAPNPWQAKDAFMASALYLTDLGGVGPSVSAQNKAACKYYGTGGSSCAYSRGVQSHKADIQDNIDAL